MRTTLRTTLELVAELFEIRSRARSVRLIDEHGEPMGALREAHDQIRTELQRRIKANAGADEINVPRLVHEYIANEILRELRDNNSKMIVRVLGEVLANREVLSEQVNRAALNVATALLNGKVQP